MASRWSLVAVPASWSSRTPRAQQGETITMTQVVTAGDFGRYLYLPFDMPEEPRSARE